MKNYLCKTTSQEFNPPILGMAKLKDYTELVPVTISKITGKYAYITITSTGESRMVKEGLREWVKGYESTKIEKYCAYIHNHSLFESTSIQEVVEHVLSVVKNQAEAIVSWGVIHNFNNGLGLTKHLKSDIIRSVLTSTGAKMHENVLSLGEGLEKQVYVELEKVRYTLYELFKTVRLG